MQGSARIDELRQKFHENPRRYFAPLANEYRKAGDPEQAIAICRAHLAQQPGHMSGHVVYAQSLYDAGRTDESRVVFEKALSLDPDNAIVLRQLGDISRQKGDTAEARHWYSRALEADPHDREIAAYIAELTEPLTEDAIAEAVAPADSQPVEILPEATKEDEVPPVEVEAQPPAIDVEVPTEPSKEPEVSVVESEASEPAEDEGELAPLPLATGSPFVTRTMADLYARQGYREQALEVYRELAIESPDEPDIADRIRELESAVKPEPIEVAPLELADIAPVDLADGAVSTTPEPSVEPINEFAEPHDSTGDIGFQAPDEVEDEAAPPEEAIGARHFTEMDLGRGDEWDSDPWAAGFSSEDMELAPFDFNPSNAEPDETIAEPVEPVAAVEATPSVEPEAVHEEAPEEIFTEEMFASTAAASTPVEDDTLVAYSPQPPDEEHLPHYTPTGPTIREFFATLGAYQLPDSDSQTSFTARAAVPEITPADETVNTPDEFPLASDAFANLFPGSPVSDEDSKAAFALSGAMSAQPPVSPHSTPPRAVAPTVTPPSPPPAPTGAAQESEEDIRRFREWLDGLADS